MYCLYIRYRTFFIIFNFHSQFTFICFRNYGILKFSSSLIAVTLTHGIFIYQSVLNRRVINWINIFFSFEYIGHGETGWQKCYNVNRRDLTLYLTENCLTFRPISICWTFRQLQAKLNIHDWWIIVQNFGHENLLKTAKYCEFTAVNVLFRMKYLSPTSVYSDFQGRGHACYI